MARKQQPNLSGLDDPNWLPLGPDLHVAQDLAGKGLRIAYRERGDPNCNLALLDPGRPPDQQSNFFYYSWGPDHSKLVPWKEEEERLRSKLSQQKEERFTPPAPRKRGRKLERLAALETRVAGIIRNRRGEEPTQRACYSIREFCTAHGISDHMFYKLQRQGLAPKTMRVGARTLVPVEAAAEWRRQCEVPAHEEKDS